MAEFVTAMKLVELFLVSAMEQRGLPGCGVGFEHPRVGDERATRKARMSL